MSVVCNIEKNYDQILRQVHTVFNLIYQLSEHSNQPVSSQALKELNQVTSQQTERVLPTQAPTEEDQEEGQDDSNTNCQQEK